MLKTHLLSYIIILYCGILLGIDAYSPTDAARLQNNFIQQQSYGQDRILQGALNAIGVQAERMNQHMQILQIIDKDSCLVNTATSDDVIHVSGIKQYTLTDGNYLPQNNIFFYGKCYKNGSNIDLLDYINRERVQLVENGIYSYIASNNAKRTIKSYKYIPFVPRKTQNGEFKYLNQNITNDELNLLWKRFGYRIYIYKGGNVFYAGKIKTHFIFSFDTNSKQADYFAKEQGYYHINLNEFIYYINNGGKFYESGYAYTYIICPRCKGTGLYKNQKCVRCLGDKKIPQKTLAYNLVTVESLRNFAKKYLDKKSNIDKDSAQNDNANSTLIPQNQEKDDNKENEEEDTVIIDKDKVDNK